MKLYDAHNHLQDERIGSRRMDWIQDALANGVVGMVVNGSCESDWELVSQLAQQFPAIIPSFGYHPWYFEERTSQWMDRLEEYLDRNPVGIGEIGLDRWKPGLNYNFQEEVFLRQWELAKERNLPVSIHCLKAWGRLLELVRNHGGPDCGFLLHSYGGPVEMISEWVSLGAYFGFPGYFLHERKQKQRTTFRNVPLDRLLIETDAPDQVPPDPIASTSSGRVIPRRKTLESVQEIESIEWSKTKEILNHPSNLEGIYVGLAQELQMEVEALASQVETNFLRLFVRRDTGT